MRQIILLLLFSLSFFEACLAQPYFGNGFHNGWADHHSVVIWTRLTQTPNLNRVGKTFLIPEGDTYEKLRRINDKDLLNQVQLPPNSNLNDMEGACEGVMGEVRLIFFLKNKPSQKRVLNWASVNGAKNFTYQWRLTDLQPNTTYEVWIEARATAQSKISDTIKGFFQTPPTAQTPKPILFSVVSCHDYIRRDDSLGGHQIYAAMLKNKPDFYVHTGDIEYYDKPSPYAFTEELMRFKWNRLFALPLQRRFWAQTTTYFQKDDHDVLSDDSNPGMTYGAVTFERGLEIFDKEQFPTNDSLFKTVRWGKDLQIWLLEGRNFRGKNNAPDGEDKTILGKTQKEWLMRTIAQSTATFKVIITPTPILGPDRGNKNDNLANKGFRYEGDEIRAFINQQHNVFICNGDRHWQYVTHRANTNLWEFGCGAGSDSHAGGWNPEDKLPEHRFLRVKGGYLTGQVNYIEKRPQLVFRHHDVAGEVVHEEIFSPQPSQAPRR